jgi:hypothetical protein
MRAIHERVSSVIVVKMAWIAIADQSTVVVKRPTPY